MLVCAVIGNGCLRENKYAVLGANRLHYSIYTNYFILHGEIHLIFLIFLGNLRSKYVIIYNGYRRNVT